MRFNAESRGYLVKSLKLIPIWLVCYVATVFTHFVLGELFSDLHINPQPQFEDFIWIDWYSTVFYAIVIISLALHVFWTLFLLPFTADNPQKKHRQFIIGLTLSVAMMIVFLAFMRVMFGMESTGIVLYTVFCLFYFPGVFIIERFFVPSTYRASYWFNGGKSKLKDDR